MNLKPGDRYLQVKDVAEFYMCSLNAVYGWIKSGKLKAYRRNTGVSANGKRGRILIKESDMHNLVVPAKQD